MSSLSRAAHNLSHRLPLARRSKQIALARERDYLQAKVLERTQELEESQLMRVLELQRFAEFGRISGRLLHEVANPLTVATLNLSQLDHRQSSALRQASKSLRQLERYVMAARKQLASQSQSIEFRPLTEIRQVLMVLRPLARAEHIQVKLKVDAAVRLKGDPVKFSQIVSNLVANAIDAYRDVDDKNRFTPKVVIFMEQTSRRTQLHVQDWGQGIPREELPRLFEPFYSTKLSSQRGLGIGLEIVKQAVENDFGGHITIRSKAGHGTTFTVCFPRNRQTT